MNKLLWKYQLRVKVSELPCAVLSFIIRVCMLKHTLLLLTFWASLNAIMAECSLTGIFFFYSTFSGCICVIAPSWSSSLVSAEWYTNMWNMLHFIDSPESELLGCFVVKCSFFWWYFLLHYCLKVARQGHRIIHISEEGTRGKSDQEYRIYLK